MRSAKSHQNLIKRCNETGKLWEDGRWPAGKGQIPPSLTEGTSKVILMKRDTMRGEDKLDRVERAGGEK